MGEEARGREERVPLIRRVRRVLRFTVGLLPVRPSRLDLRYLKNFQAGPEDTGEKWGEVEVGVAPDED